MILCKARITIYYCWQQHAYSAVAVGGTGMMVALVWAAGADRGRCAAPVEAGTVGDPPSCTTPELIGHVLAISSALLHGDIL